MKHMVTFIEVIIMLLSSNMIFAKQDGKHPIEFRQGSGFLSDRYGDNSQEITAIKQIVSDYKDIIFTGNGHIRLIAPIGNPGHEDLTAINLAALRAAKVRGLLQKNFRMLTDWSFTFYVDSTRADNQSIEVQYIPLAVPTSVSSGIYYTEKQNNLPAIKQALSKYGQLPYLDTAPPFGDDEKARAHFDKINSIATSPVDVAPKEGEPNPEKLLIAIHYRWDKYNLDSLYLSNPQNLHLLDSILNSSNSAYIDTLTIVAYASPEGNPAYNKRLSERRALTIKNYITSKYKMIPPDRVVTDARGENWKGLRNFATQDQQLPSRTEVLGIIDSPLPSLQKQDRLTKLNEGVTYYRYILPNYYRYLRNGASVLITYNPNMPKDPGPYLPAGLALLQVPPPALVPGPDPIQLLSVIKYPVAFKTNLLYDAVGALNIGVEIPIKEHYSVIADFAYSYWRSRKNLYALQTLQGGVEARYWFGVSDKKKQKNPEWAKPLRGWNVGAYGMYCSRYDMQWIAGYQGDGFWSAGATAGYATPIARNLTLEFSVAAGYLHTPEYRHYHRPEYDSAGKYHLMWQETGRYSTFTLTRLQISLVWMIQTTKTQKRRNNR